MNVVDKFPVGVVISAYTGIMCCHDFSKVHECIEWAMGHPVWQHEMGTKDFFKKIQRIIEKQALYDFSNITKENALDYAQKHKGEIIKMHKGSEQRDKNPIQSLAERFNQ